jgi:hypothetical protein
MNLNTYKYLWHIERETLFYILLNFPSSCIRSTLKVRTAHSILFDLSFSNEWSSQYDCCASCCDKNKISFIEKINETTCVII